MSISFIQQLNDSTVFCLKNNEHIIHNIKKKKFSDTFRRNSVLDSKTTVNIKNILKLINSSYNEDTYKKNIEHIINDPLFDKNNGKFLNKIWEKNSDYFLDRDQSIFNSEVKKAFAKNNDKLIKIFLDNGLNYIDKFILCVDPSSYSHSAIILKFNKPIKFDDSNADVAGVLYTLSMDSKHNNSKKTILTKIFRFFRQLLSFIFTWKFHMAKILLTSDDLNYIELENRDKSLEKFSIDGKNIECTLESSFNILDTLEKAKNLNLVNYTVSEYNNLLKSLTSNIQKISYFFNIYNINISKDKIINYSFDNNNNLNLDISSNKNGYSIYDFLWEDCEKLNLTHERKLHVIKKFLEVESLKLLKENNIIDKNATEFNFSDFYKLPKKIPSDLREKFRYTKITTFDLNKEPLSSLNVSSLEVSKRGYRLMSKLEKFNTKQEFYCFFQNNCITTLKRTISKCSKEHKELIKNANKNLNIIEKRHPLSVFNELKKLNKDK